MAIRAVNRPTRVYKYEPVTVQTLRNLKSQKVFFGSPSRFNDPYDCALRPKIIPPSDEELELIRQRLGASPDLPPELFGPFQRLPLNRLREQVLNAVTTSIERSGREFLDKRGVTCFSEANDNLLMWAHYADKCRGFCLEFDVQQPLFEKLRKVTYQEKMPEISISDFLLLGPEKSDFIDKLYCTKSQDWAYEKEWRGIHMDRDTAFGYEATGLTGVYFGPETPDADVEIICLILQGQNETVRFYRGKRANAGYGVVFTQFTYTNFLEAKRMGPR